MCTRKGSVFFVFFWMDRAVFHWVVVMQQLTTVILDSFGRVLSFPCMSQLKKINKIKLAVSSGVWPDEIARVSVFTERQTSRTAGIHQVWNGQAKDSLYGEYCSYFWWGNPHQLVDIPGSSVAALFGFKQRSKPAISMTDTVTGNIFTDVASCAFWGCSHFHWALTELRQFPQPAACKHWVTKDLFAEFHCHYILACHPIVASLCQFCCSNPDLGYVWPVGVSFVWW